MLMTFEVFLEIPDAAVKTVLELNDQARKEADAEGLEGPDYLSETDVRLDTLHFLAWLLRKEKFDEAKAREARSRGQGNRSPFHGVEILAFQDQEFPAESLTGTTEANLVRFLEIHGGGLTEEEAKAVADGELPLGVAEDEPRDMPPGNAAVQQRIDKLFGDESSDDGS